MATDENNPGGKGDQEPAAQEPAAQEPQATPAPSGTPAASGADAVKSGPPPKGETPQEIQDRKNAAKAFYRAMYAGEDVEPEQFGIGGSGSGARPGGGGGGGGQSGPCPNCARMEKELAEAEKAKTEAENYYKRILADFENYRKRTDRERDDAINLGIQKAVVAILPALDDLDRAKAVLATVSDPRSVTESLNLVFARFAKTLEPLGIKPMEVVGEPFDPKFHEPVQEVQTNEFPDGAVVQDLRKGYMMGDKIIRPSLVNVASNESGIVVPKAAPPQEPAATAPASSAPEPAAPAKADVVPEPSASEEVEAESNSEAESKAEEKPAEEKQATEPPAEEKPAEEQDNVLASGEASSSSSPTQEIDIEKLKEAIGQGRAAKSAPPEKDYDPLATADVPVYDPNQFLDAGGNPDRVYEIPENIGDEEPGKEADFAETAAAKKQVLDE
jgi:molecular chaperone GrpE